MAKNSKVREFNIGAGDEFVWVGVARMYGDRYKSHLYPLYISAITPSSLRRVLRAIAKMAGADEQTNRIAQAEEAERKARTR